MQCVCVAVCIYIKTFAMLVSPLWKEYVWLCVYILIYPVFQLNTCFVRIYTYKDISNAYFSIVCCDIDKLITPLLYPLLRVALSFELMHAVCM